MNCPGSYICGLSSPCCLGSLLLLHVVLLRASSSAHGLCMQSPFGFFMMWCWRKKGKWGGGSDSSQVSWGLGIPESTSASFYFSPISFEPGVPRLWKKVTVIVPASPGHHEVLSRLSSCTGPFLGTCILGSYAHSVLPITLVYWSQLAQACESGWLHFQEICK